MKSGEGKRLDILCLGEPMAEFAEIGADGGPALWRAGVGGDVSNVAVAAARQGMRAGVATRLGRDAFGDDVLEFWSQEGIDADAVERDPDAPTGLYFIRQTPDGHVFEYRRAGSAASRLSPRALPEQAIRETRILHASGISQAISETAEEAVDAAMALARAAGAAISFDPNLRLKLWPLDRARVAIDRAIGAADIALPGLDDARKLTGLDAPEQIALRYLELGPQVVALTLGADGALIATAERMATIPSPPAEAVDASGAGDCFDGAFLSEWLRTGDPFESGAYAAAAASLSVQGYGAAAPIPREAEVRALMRTSP